MKNYVVIGCLILSLTLAGQTKNEAILTLLDNSHDFGRIREDHGIVSHTFSFSNTGSKTLVLTNVRSTCGCTTPKWSKQPVSPGEAGFVTVEFNPKDRPGSFHKTIQMQSTAKNSNMFLTITGNVLPALNEEKLDYKVGTLSVKSKHINLGYIFSGNTGMETLAIANLTDDPMELDLGDVPDHITAYIHPSELQPGEYGQIEIHYNSDVLDDWDVVIDRISVIINGKRDKKAKLAVTANIREDFSTFTEEQLLYAPVAYFDKNSYSFDTITGNKPVEYSFLLKNIGKSDLIIRAVKPSCGCTVVEPKNKILSPGDSTRIGAKFDPKGRSGNVKNAITVITNDPKSYKQYLWIEGYILR